MAISRTSLPLILAALSFAACRVAPNEIDKQLFVPPAPWLAEPADFGLLAEPFEITLHSNASLTGFWIPHDNGEKRTVVLLHDGTTNASVLHPYYRFLHDAGFQVLVLDPRGFGKSKGEPTMQAWLYDLRDLFAWLRARPDVDMQKIALFGTGIGSVAALWAARTQGCQALVLEHLPSPRDMLRENMHDDGGALSAMQLGFTEATRLPEEVEPDENAPRTKVPALFLVTDGERASDRKALVRTFGLYAGPKQLWLLANTAHAPNAFLTYDGEYQQQIAAFLQSALAGSPRVCEATAQKGEVARDQQTWWQMQVTPPPASRQGNPPPRLAIEACAVLADGSAHFARTWSDQATARVRTKLPAPPVCTTAVVVPGAVDDAEAVFRREPTALTRSGASVAALWGRIEDLRNETLAGTAIRALHADLVAAEAKVPFHPLLEAELADVFARIGKELAASQDPAERATGTKLLQRAVAAMPKDPRLHVWPGPTPTYGYPYEDTIEMAKRLLAAPPK